MIKLVLILLIFSSLLDVKAYSEFQREKIIPTEEKEVEKSEFCFREEKEVAYLPEDEFYLAEYDLNDYEVVYGEWQEDKDFSGEYEEKTNYYYEDIKEVRYIHLVNNSSPDDKIMINRVAIAYHADELDYEVSCHDCPNDLYYKVNNGNSYYEGFYLTEESELVLDLGDYYELEYLTFNMFVSNYEHGANRFEIQTTRDQTNIFTKAIFWSWFSNDEGAFSWYQYHLLDETRMVDPSYYERVEVDELQESSRQRRYFSQTYYREKIYHYKNYEYKAIETEKANSDYCVDKYRYRLIENESEEEIPDEIDDEPVTEDDVTMDNAYGEAENFFDENGDATSDEATKESSISDEKELEESPATDEKATEENVNKDDNKDANDSEKTSVIGFNGYAISAVCLLLVVWFLRRYVKN